LANALEKSDFIIILELSSAIGMVGLENQNEYNCIELKKIKIK
jgi:hypothetical protein